MLEIPVDNLAQFSVMDSILYYIYYTESSSNIILFFLLFLFGPFVFYVCIQIVYFSLKIGPAATFSLLFVNALILWVIHIIYVIINATITTFFY